MKPTTGKRRTWQSNRRQRSYRRTCARRLRFEPLENRYLLSGGTLSLDIAVDSIAENAGAMATTATVTGNNLNTKLTSSDGAAADEFGNSVSISGTTAVVGAPYDDEVGDSSGSAYIFEQTGGTWSEVDKLTADSGASGDMFGSSLSVSGTTAIVGAPGELDAAYGYGSAYIFEQSGGVWSQAARLTPLQAEFVGLGDLSGGSFFSRATDVSADGLTVVGFSESADGSQAFRWTAGGGITGLGNSGDLSHAWAVSADGSVAVGDRDYGVNGGIQPYRWDTTSGGGTPVYAGPSGGIAYDVSADGSVIVGRRSNDYGFRTPPYNTLKGPTHGWYGGAYAVSADGETVVGNGFTGAGGINWWEATKWEGPWNSYGGDVRGEGLGRLLGDSVALAISDDGTTIVGQSGAEAVRFGPGGIIGLGFLPGGHVSSATAVSADGSLIFGSAATGAFIWDESNGMRDLKRVLESEYGLE